VGAPIDMNACFSANPETCCSLECQLAAGPVTRHFSTTDSIYQALYCVGDLRTIRELMENQSFAGNMLPPPLKGVAAFVVRGQPARRQRPHIRETEGHWNQCRRCPSNKQFSMMYGRNPNLSLPPRNLRRPGTTRHLGFEWLNLAYLMDKVYPASGALR